MITVGGSIQVAPIFTTQAEARPAALGGGGNGQPLTCGSVEFCPSWILT